MIDYDEQIEDGDDPPELDVHGQQGPVNWSGEPVSDNQLSLRVRAMLKRLFPDS